MRELTALDGVTWARHISILLILHAADKDPITAWQRKPF
jgi:hypothetical protein